MRNTFKPTHRPEATIQGAFLEVNSNLHPHCLDHIRTLLRDHDRRGHGMRANYFREDRRVANTKTLHAVHLQLRIHDARSRTISLEPHAAGRRIMEAGHGVLPDKAVDAFVAVDLRDKQVSERVTLLADVLGNAQRKAHPSAQRHVVLSVGEGPDVDGWSGACVARDQAHGTLRLWPDERDEEGESALPRCLYADAVDGYVHEFDVRPVVWE